MSCKYICYCALLIFVISFVLRCRGWRAVPANQAVYALRSPMDDDDDAFSVSGKGDSAIPDELLPRIFLHSNYKFGWCTRDATQKQFLRKSINMTLVAYLDSRIRYIYLLDHKHTQRFRLQCIMMKMYVPRKYLFKKGRIPMYYCQGQVYILAMNTIQKIELHEFYIQTLLSLPANFLFEFYHPIEV